MVESHAHGRVPCALNVVSPFLVVRGYAAGDTGASTTFAWWAFSCGKPCDSRARRQHRFLCTEEGIQASQGCCVGGWATMRSARGISLF